MPNYKGVDYEARIKKHPDTGKYQGGFTITEYQGDKFIKHGPQSVTNNGTDEIAEFDTEDEAREAATQVARKKIDELTS